MAVRQLARRACRQGTKVSCVLENVLSALDKVSTRSKGIFLTFLFICTFMQLCMATHNFKRKINITDSEPVFLQFRFLLWIYNYIFAVKTLIPKVKVNISIATHLNV